MSKIVLGKYADRDAKLDLDTLLRTRMLIQANSGNPRGRLRTLGLVEYPQKGQVRAAELLFIQ